MKQTFTNKPSLLKVIGIVALMLFAGVKSANACHGVMIVSPNQQVNPSDVVITGFSDAATCGCGPYWMEVELTCNPNGFTGAPPIPSSPLWGNVPWYHSLLDVPTHTAAQAWYEDCIVEPYAPITIPFSQLCPGTQYYWRVREYVEGANSPGPWSGSFTFTTPGLPPSAILSTTSVLQSTNQPQYSGCPGDIFQFNASVSGGCPGATFSYQWSPATGLNNPNIANPVCTLATNITYTVTATGGCFTITSNDDTVRLSVGPPPAPGTPLSTPTSVCSGQSSWVVLSGQTPNSTIQWEVSTNGVNWFNVSGATDDSLNTGPLASTLYYHAIVTGTGWPGSGCGSSVSPPVQVTVNQSPVADAGQNNAVCAGGCTNLTGSGGVTYNWQPGNLSGSTVNVCPPGNTTYTLYITDANGCSDSDMVTINISTPTVAASPSVSICNGNSTILVASGAPGQTYSWTPPATLTGANTPNPTATPTVTTTYTVTATNFIGCTVTDSVTVQVTNAPPITASSDTSLCNGGQATLTVSGAATYSWSPGNMSGSTVVVSPPTTTTYVITGNTNNCLSYDTVVVVVAPPLTVYAGPDFDVCNGTQVTLNVGLSGGTYQWLPAASIIGATNTQSVVAAPTGNTSYTVNVTDANGCISSDTINITVNPSPNVSASSPDVTICQGQSTFVNAVGAANYVWTPAVGLTSPSLSSTAAQPQNTTTYMVTGTDQNGCMATDTITVFILENPFTDLTTIATQCGDTSGQIALNGSAGGTPPYVYTMGSSVVTMPVTGLAAGTYLIMTTDANGCTTSNGMVVFTQNTSAVDAAASPNYGTYPLTSNFSATGSAGVNNFTWTFQGAVPATATGQNPSGIVFGAPGTYEVIVTAWNDDPNCAVYDTIYITVVEQATIALPNIFTPNADANNDFFAATVSGVSDINVEVYDRWGALVYKGAQGGLTPTPQIVQLWDGTDSGKAAVDGVYYYIVTAVGYDMLTYPMTGFVHVVTTKP
jgi:gliding motility-associated-like protein